mmetsp:Transcript_1392/g.2042  ORF Transcript_1392/g.2042 Transcript_1392/m.2042 type:complete len:335 (-) Transcript_1392:121-1125(-)
MGETSVDFKYLAQKQLVEWEQTFVKGNRNNDVLNASKTLLTSIKSCDDALDLTERYLILYIQSAYKLNKLPEADEFLWKEFGLESIPAPAFLVWASLQTEVGNARYVADTASEYLRLYGHVTIQRRGGPSAGEAEAKAVGALVYLYLNELLCGALRATAGPRDAMQWLTTNLWIRHILSEAELKNLVLRLEKQMHKEQPATRVSTSSSPSSSAPLNTAKSGAGEVEGRNVHVNASSPSAIDRTASSSSSPRASPGREALLRCRFAILLSSIKKVASQTPSAHWIGGLLCALTMVAAALAEKQMMPAAALEAFSRLAALLRTLVNRLRDLFMLTI